MAFMETPEHIEARVMIDPMTDRQAREYAVDLKVEVERLRVENNALHAAKRDRDFRVLREAMPTLMIGSGFAGLIAGIVISM